MASIRKLVFTPLYFQLQCLLSVKLQANRLENKENFTAVLKGDLPMTNYEPIAQRKIDSLKSRADFNKIETSNQRYTILFFNKTVCKVTNRGNVTWG